MVLSSVISILAVLSELLKVATVSDVPEFKNSLLPLMSPSTSNAFDGVVVPIPTYHY